MNKTTEPPNNPQAERAALGAMLINAAAVPVAVEILGDGNGAFYVPGHGLVYAAIRALNSRNQPVDPVTVSEELIKTGNLELAGGVSYLSDLSTAVPTSANTAHYAGIVRDLAVDRKRADLARRLNSALGDSVERARILDNFRALDTAQPVADAPPVTLPESWETVQIPPHYFVMGTGCPAQHVTLIAASGGLGKSTLALEVAVSCTTGRELLPGWKPREPGRVLILSFEDDIAIIMRRLQSVGFVFDLDSGECAAVRERVQVLPIMEPRFFIGDGYRGYRTGPDMDRLRRAIETFNPALVIIDPAAALLSGVVCENDNGEVQKVVCHLRALLPPTSAILLLTHTSKVNKDTAESARGASAWHDAARQVFSLRPGTTPKKTAAGGASVIVLEARKSNYSALPPTLFLERSTGGVFVPAEHDPAAAEKNDRAAVEFALLTVLAGVDCTAREIGGTGARKTGAAAHGAAVRAQIEALTGQRLSGNAASGIVDGMLFDGRLFQVTGPRGRLILKVNSQSVAGVAGRSESVAVRAVAGVAPPPIGGRTLRASVTPSQSPDDAPPEPDDPIYEEEDYGAII